jgi:hypothetical protein
VHLKANGTVISTVVLDEENGWKHTFTGLRKTDDMGVEILYTVTEDPVPYYTAKIKGFRITNVYDAPTTEVEVQKIWNDDDNKAGLRPKSIIMKLSNGQVVILNEENGWKAKITGLPLIVNGKPVSYSWTEQEVIGYELEQVTVDGTVTTFTNKLSERPTPPPDKPVPPTPGKPTVIIDEYDTPLGIEIMINHVGDCFD